MLGAMFVTAVEKFVLVLLNRAPPAHVAPPSAERDR